jgi:hypothetical protein
MMLTAALFYVAMPHKPLRGKQQPAAQPEARVAAAKP